MCSLNERVSYIGILCHTPIGKLAGDLMAYERRRGANRQIIIVESAGVSLKSKLFTSNPWAKEGKKHWSA